MDIQLHDMRLHETITVTLGPANFTIIRVHGGWLYYNYDGSSTFVPWISPTESNEQLKK